jgi:DNA helicase-2/ATP-dependent DNA helicase PcrA
MEYNPNFKIEKLDLIDYYFNKLLDLPFKKRIEKLKEYIIEQLNLRIPNNEFIKKYSQLCNEKYNVDTKKLFIDLFNTKKSLLLEFANNETEFNILNNNMLDVISGKLSYEDSLIYIYFKFKIEGYCINEKYSHVIIEEFQDYQYIHLKILRETFKNACITLVVNNQCKLYKAKTRIFQNNIFDIINDIFIDTVKRPIFYNIRSSKDICLYINKHKGQKIKYLNQNISNRIRVIKEIDIKSRLRKIIACIDIEKYRRIGIIVYSLNELVDNMNPRLLKDNKINIIDDDKKSTLDGYINILPCYATYGLEFDYLVIFNKESYSENMRIFKMLLCKTVDKVDVYE